MRRCGITFTLIVAFSGVFFAQRPNVQVTPHFGGPPPDPALAQRREAIKRVVSAARGEPLPDNVIPAIQDSLGDADRDVRSSATVALLAAMERTASGALRPSVAQALRRSREGLLDALRKNLDDPDDFIRSGVVTGLTGFPDPLDQRTRSEVIGRYAREQNWRVRNALVMGFKNNGASNRDVQDLLVQALDDDVPRVRYSAAMGVATSHSPEALSRVVAGLQRYDDAESRGAFAYALSAYGRDAKQYLPILQNLLAPESRQNVAADLAHAIRQISDAK